MKKKRLLALILALAMLLPLPGMMGEVHAESQQSPPECTTHNPMEQAYDIPAGCTEPGYTNAVRCYDCGKILSYDSIIPPTGHSYTTHKWEWIHATCTEEGELEWMCDNPGCGQTERYTLPPLGHVPVPCAEEPASCLYEGSTGGTRCSRCDQILTEPEVVPALGHDFSRLHTEWGATCKRAAGYRNECSREGCMEVSTVDNYIEGPHGIHRWSYAGRELVGQDYKYVWICSDCDKHFYADDTNTRPSAHTSLSYETKYPTCTEDGYKDRLICKYHCGQILYDGITLPATGHALGEIILEHPDCTNPGRAYKQCAHGCGERTEEYKLPPTGHSWYADYSTARCTDNGVWRCRTCGASDDTVEVEPRGHDWVTIHTVPASGDQPGKEIQYCTRCGTRQDIILGSTEGGDEGEGEGGGGGEEHVCEFTEPHTIQQPSCTEPGLKAYKCTCGNIGSTTEEIAPLGHQYERKVIKPPTCTEAGETGDVCVREGCMDIRDGSAEPIAALGHEWERVVKKAPTIDETGLYVNRCIRCNEEEAGSEEEIPQLQYTQCEHEWKTIVTRWPTCTEKGLERTHCELCEIEHPDSPHQIPALGHNLEIKYHRLPSCTRTGINVMRCQNPGCTFETTLTYPLESHSWMTQVKRQPTCTEAGLSVEVCSECGQERPNSGTPIELAEHQYERTTILEPKCLEYGKSIMKCTVCGTEDPDTEERIDPPGHNWEYQVIEEPSCAEKGWKQKICTVCGREGDLDLIDKLEHDWVQDEDKDPTCTEWGRLSGHCAICGHTESLDLEPHGHDWIDVKTIREPNCKDPGVKLVKCRICNEEEEQAIPTIDEHDLVEEILVEPTCTEWGKFRMYCKICGREPVKGDKPPKGHTEVPLEDEPLSCMQGGTVGATKCSVCGEILNKGTYRPAIGHHNWGDDNVLEPSTCTTRGRAQDFCTVCGVERIRDLPIEPHDWRLVSLYAPTCVAEGAEQWECQTCGRRGRVEYVSKSEEHKWLTRQGKEATCSEPGYTESISCELCGKIQKYPEPIPTTPHKEVIIHSMRPTSTLEGRTEGIRCERCGIWIIECKTLPKLAPERTENDVSEQPAGWAKGSDETASFRSEADIDEFSHVAVDGEMVNESNYDLKEGSTIVIFKPEYLETLPLGEHEVEIVSIASSAFGTLNITSKEALAALLEQEAREALAAQEIQPAQEADAAARGLGNSYYYILPALIILLAGGVFLVLHKRRMAK